MEKTPEAAPQNVGTEAQPTNITPETPASQPEAPKTPENNDLQGFTSEQLSEMRKFMDANGGFDKAFKNFRERISTPAPEPVKTESTVSEQPKQPEQVQGQPQPQQLKPVPAGFMTQQEFMAQQYYNSLANEDEFKPIADKIRSGEVFNEMRKFGIQPIDEQGNINNVQAREFLGLLAKTVPATPAGDVQEAAAPTVDYIPTNGGKIESMEQAGRIIAQSEDLRNKGLAEHPDLAAAREFIKSQFATKTKK